MRTELINYKLKKTSIQVSFLW